MKKLYEQNTNDYILAALIVIISALPILTSDIFSDSGEKQALIYKNNTLAYTLNLSEDKEINIDKMTIMVKAGKIRVENSDCPQKICVNSGWISKPVEKIVCIPNKVLIEITGAPKEKEYDTISY